MSYECLEPEQLLAILAELPAATGYRVAFSGGTDSLALLHALASKRAMLGAPVYAVHVNHGLHADASRWEQHCAGVCAELKVGLTIRRVDVDAGPGQSVEERARDARYEALAQTLDPGVMLLTAHQRDDQAETLLLNLFRGSGPHGLSAMPSCRRFGVGYLGRPLLAYPRAALARYVLDTGMQAVKDDSNDDRRFARNFLRQDVLPRLRERWPTLSRTLARVRQHQLEAVELIDALASQDLERVSTPQGVACSALAELSAARQHYVLRAWVAGAGLPLPAEKHLQRIRTDLLRDGVSGAGLVRWRGAECRRYRACLYLGPPLPDHDPTKRYRWRLEQSLVLPHGFLRAAPVTGHGLRVPGAAGPVEVRFRTGGERCRPVGRAHSQRLKKLFQEAAIPPWMRNRIPLIYFKDTLVAVVGQWVCQGFQAHGAEQGWLLEWSTPGGEQDAP